MVYICSVGLGIPENPISQDRVKKLVQEIFPHSKREIKRLLPVFDHAKINERQLVVDEEWFKIEHTFKERNDLYSIKALEYSLSALDKCLKNANFLTKDIPYESIDMLVFVSSTGITTPSIDAYVMNERPFREDVKRMPLWGLGCAGGAIALSRAADWLTANPNKVALVVCAELCSLTFQKEDTKISNFIGTALFGDGASAALLIGEKSTYLKYRKKYVPKVVKTSSFTPKGSLDIMGWEVTNNGFEVIFSKRIPKLVKTIWKDHIISFLENLKLTEKDIHSFIAHPGGRKILEAMEETLAIPRKKLVYSYNTLANHGNMSSATVFYVLYSWLTQTVNSKEKSILSALGPGFSSELILLEWM